MRQAATQDAIMEFVRDYKVASDGNSPTYQQIADALNRNPKHIYEKVQRLCVRGLLRIDPDTRKIVLGGQYIPPE